MELAKGQKVLPQLGVALCRNYYQDDESDMFKLKEALLRKKPQITAIELTV